MRLILRSALLMVALTVLASCASLSEDECRAGDWRQIGVADGAEGYGPERLEAHRRACADAGIAPDPQAWAQGRQEGLRLYCTPAKAYRVAREGRNLRQGCTAAELSRMQPAYDWGEQYWRIEQEIDRIRDRIRDAGREASSLPPDAPGRGFLLARRSMLASELSLAEMRQDRYATWP